MSMIKAIHVRSQKPQARKHSEAGSTHCRRPVQFGIRINPLTAAITKPNSISRICQDSGSKRVGSCIAPKNTASQSASAMTAQLAAARHIGRKA